MTGRSVADTIRELLDQGTARIIVDATRPGVLVPVQHKHQTALHLNLSYALDGHNMRFGREALCVTLYFGRAALRCELPWGAIVAAGLLDKEQSEPERRRGHLTLVKL